MEADLVQALKSESEHAERFEGCWGRGPSLQEVWSRCSHDAELETVAGLIKRVHGITPSMAQAYAGYWDPDNRFGMLPADLLSSKAPFIQHGAS
jgi:hypothetical protein